ncbi:MAG: M23 family metallopeptidase [Clostridia bacterium]|nr:M23 family metallopeptidase [Clostridia bacterium]
MKENNKKKKTGAGFYIALCCCVAAMGIVGFVNTQNKQLEEQMNSDSAGEIESMPVITLPPEPSSEPVVEVEAQKVAEIKQAEKKPETETENIYENADVIESGENAEFYDGAVVESVSIKDTPVFTMPVDGEICHKFTGDELYYDKVMGDYRTHNGIDIKAESDSEVVCAADGIIESVYTGTLGKTVIINHNNGYYTTYANLDDIENLSEGMELKEGDFIAHVGNYAHGEQTTEPHIHFEIVRDDVYLNPEDYLD